MKNSVIKYLLISLFLISCTSKREKYHENISDKVKEISNLYTLYSSTNSESIRNNMYSKSIDYINEISSLETYENGLQLKEKSIVYLESIVSLCEYDKDLNIKLKETGDALGCFSQSIILKGNVKESLGAFNKADANFASGN